MADKVPLGKKLAMNMDKIVMGVLWLMVGGLGYVWFAESNSTVGVDAESGKPADLSDPVTKKLDGAKVSNWDKLNKMSGQPQIQDYPQIQQAAQYNMFDYKSVRDRQEIEKGAEQKFAQAKTLSTSQKPEAVRLLKEILIQVPMHKQARELLNQLEPPATETPAT